MLDESFWLAVNFFIFVFLAYKFLKPTIFSFLDKKIEAIKSDLHTAQEMKKEAEKLLEEASLIYSKIDAKYNEIIANANNECRILFESHEKKHFHILSNMEKGLQIRSEQSKNIVLSELEHTLMLHLHDRIIEKIKEKELPNALEVIKKVCT